MGPHLRELPMSPTVHPERLEPSELGRAAVGGDALPEPLPAPRSRHFRDATESELANASGGVCTRGEELAGKQAAPVGAADMWDVGMPPLGYQEQGQAWGGGAVTPRHPPRRCRK